ncbi:MAG: hypothetical protein AAF723_10470, partial [Pseudomonadota bacterium]
FLPFILDTSITLWKRWREGKSLFSAHKEHFYQRLRAKGFSHQAVSCLYGGLIATSGGMAYGLSQTLGGLGVWLAGALSIALFAGVISMLFQQAREPLI